MDLLKQRLIKELVQLGTDESEHSTRSLLDHLQGVFAVLEQWGNPPEICLAGLFHSVYGTESYRTQSVELNQRQYIRELIGDRAEELSYLFCACDKKHFTGNFMKSSGFAIRDLFRGEDLAISDETFRALVEISLANLLEQLPSVELLIERQVLEGLFEEWKGAKPHVSPKAYQHFLAYFGSLHMHTLSVDGDA